MDGRVGGGCDSDGETIVGLSELKVVVEVDLRLRENMMRVGVQCDLCCMM